MPSAADVPSGCQNGSIVLVMLYSLAVFNTLPDVGIRVSRLVNLSVVGSPGYPRHVLCTRLLSLLR